MVGTFCATCTVTGYYCLLFASVLHIFKQKKKSFTKLHSKFVPVRPSLGNVYDDVSNLCSMLYSR